MTYGADGGLGQQATEIVTGDFDGDGLTDVLGADGTFAAEATLQSTPGADVIAVADMNGDGRPDIVTADDGKLILFYNSL